jgi:hypothetical protein
MWLKLHLMCGVKTNIVTSVQVSDGYAHEYHYYKGLVDQTKQIGFGMKEVSADKAYLGAESLLTTLRNGAIPYIPFKSNSVPDSRGRAQSRNYGRACLISTVCTVRSSCNITTSGQTSKPLFT